ncbi:hypothetical protein [Methylosinus sporium]|uniref:hypothetical protein n=1 Tax=Methylosinus sporium TaxID=428 RepID=UPI00383A430F
MLNPLARIVADLQCDDRRSDRSRDLHRPRANSGSDRRRITTTTIHDAKCAQQLLRDRSQLLAMGRFELRLFRASQAEQSDQIGLRRTVHLDGVLRGFDSARHFDRENRNILFAPVDPRRLYLGVQGQNRHGASAALQTAEADCYLVIDRQKLGERSAFIDQCRADGIDRSCDLRQTIRRIAHVLAV